MNDTASSGAAAPGSRPANAGADASSPKAIAEDLLAREGLALDRHDWDAWLDLYAEDAVYWIPTWRSEHELVEDVQREVSLVYLTSRAGLHERVIRLRSRKTVLAMPLPRTVHQVANVLAQREADGTISGTAAWTVNEFDPRTSRTRQQFGRYEFRLREAAGAWRYAMKKTIVVNDLYPAIIEIFNV